MFYEEEMFWNWESFEKKGWTVVCEVLLIAGKI